MMSAFFSFHNHLSPSPTYTYNNPSILNPSLPVETQNLASPVQRQAFYRCDKCFFRSTFIACETQDFASLLGYRNHPTPPSPRIRIPPMPFNTAQTPFNPYRINLSNTIKSEIKTNIQYFSTIRHVPTLAFTDKKR